MKIAVYPGSFDPITIGHVDIVERVSKLVDRVIVLVSEAPDKKSLFTVDERKKLIQNSLAQFKNVTVESHAGLTIEYLRQKQAKILIRGLRAVADFEYEFSLSSMNLRLAPEIETLLMFARPEYYYVSSRSVKEIAQHRGDLKGLVPEPVRTALEGKFR
jgi:pantetheine-phosphate adenylyltransferase